MRLRFYVSVCAGFLFLAPVLVGAQDFGVLESAETINQGIIKLGVYPLIAFPDGGDNEFSLPVSIGYGVTDSFDVEGRAAFSEDVIFAGGDGEYWFLKNQPLDVSARAEVGLGVTDESSHYFAFGVAFYIR